MKNLFTLFLMLISFQYAFCQFGSDRPIAPTFIEPSNAQFFDIDQDGDLDVISASYGALGHMTWLENTDGLGHFSNPKVIYEHPTIRFFEIHPFDLDDDGDLDMLAAGFDSESANPYVRRFYVVENLGAIDNYAMPTEIAEIDNIRFFIKDINGDTYPDFVEMRADDFLVWRTYEGNLNYSAQHAYGFDGIDTWSFDITDLNADGRFDIVFTGASPNLLYRYLGVPGGDDFEETPAFANVGYFDNVQLANLDDDADLDLLVWGYNGAGFEWYENLDGLGGFDTVGISIDTFGTSAAVIEVADFDNDGFNDLIYGFRGLAGEYPENEIIKIGLNPDGDGIFENFQPFFNKMDGTFYTESGDVDGDGDLDFLLVSSGDQAIRVFKNEGAGNFGMPDLLATPEHSGTEEIVVVDFDSDGIQDIIALGANKISLFQRNNFDQEFLTETILYNQITNGYSLGAKDIDNDGDIDLVYSDEGSGLTYYLENLGGLGNFATPALLGYLIVHEFYFYDINEDGLEDIMFSASPNFGISNNSIGWFENLGNEFSAPIYIDDDLFKSGIFQPTDFDNDGDIDFLAVIKPDLGGETNLVWYKQTAPGVYSNPKFLTATGFVPLESRFVDFDNDGDIDLLSLVRNSLLPNVVELRFYEDPGTNPNLVWQFNVLYENNLIFIDDEYLAVGDLDDDGFKDVVISHDNGLLSWHKNVNGTVALVSEISNFGRRISLGNLDDDTDLDVITWGNNNLFWNENQINHGSVQGVVFLDENENGVKEPNEFGLNNQTIQINPQEAFAWTGENGIYGFGLSPGEYDIALSPDNAWLPTTSLSAPVTIQTNGDNEMVDFGLKPNGVVYEVGANISTGIFRCNMETPFWLMYYNAGNQNVSGIITLEVDPLAIFIDANPSPTTINGNTIQWEIADIPPTQDGKIYAQIEMPGVDEIGEFIDLEATVTIQNNDGLPVYTDVYQVSEELICAYDPNDKMVAPSYPNFENYVLFGDTLEYTVRFQNTGSDTAFNVKITDFLDSHLDYATFRTIGASHDYEVTLNEYGAAIFEFDNILLPDSTTNFLGSQGFVKYQILPKTGLPNYTPIFNEAHIFFDQNPAIVTNETESILVEKLPLETVVQNPICHDAQDGFVQLLPELYAVDYEWSTGGNDFEILDLNDGEYSVTVTDLDGRWLFDTTLSLMNPPVLALNPFSTPSGMSDMEGTAGLLVTGGVAPYSYLWDTEPTQTTESILNLTAGDYTVTVVDAVGCQKEATITVSQFVNTAQISTIQQFTITPNPTSEDCWIKIEPKPVHDWQLTVHDIYGKFVKNYTSENLGIHNTSLNIQNLPTGIYLISWLSKDTVLTKRLVVE